MAKKPGGLLAIIGSPKGEPDGDEGGGSDPAKDIETNAMSDFLDAIKAEDPAAMKSAFKRAYDACAAASEGMSEEY
jgi:hypothetical protein